MFSRKPSPAERFEIVKLKNGAEAPKPLVTTTMLSLRGLLKNTKCGLIALFDLKELCKNPDYNIMFSKDLLLSCHLLEIDSSSGKISVNPSIKEIVLSAVDGEDINVTLVTPELLEARASGHTV